MKRLFVPLFGFALISTSHAGRSGYTEIENIIVKENYVEIYTVSDGGCGSNNRRWHLHVSHNNFNALYSGFLATKTSGKKVDIAGNNTCGNGEDISWAYVVK